MFVLLVNADLGLLYLRLNLNFMLDLDLVLESLEKKKTLISDLTSADPPRESFQIKLMQRPGIVFVNR